MPPRYSPLIIVAAMGALLLFVPHMALLFATLFLAIVFSLLLDAPVSVLVTKGLNRPLATVLVVVVTLGLLAGLAIWLVPVVASDLNSISSLHRSFPDTLAVRLNHLLAHLPTHPHVKASQLQFSALFGDIGRLHVLSSLSEAFVAVSAAAIIAIWTVANPAALEDKLRLLIPDSHREATVHLAAVVTDRLKRWLVGQSIINLYAGGASALLFMLLGVPYWPFFALLAFILEVIPTFGVLLAATGPALLLLADHPDRLIWLAIGLVIVHQLEDRLIIPHVMGKASDLPQAMVAFAILAFGLIWGPAGVIMAVPVSATLMAVFIEWRTGSVPSPNRDPTPDPPALASVDDPIPAVSTSEDPSS